MSERVCPWWLGYFLASPLRRLMLDPYQLLAPYVREGMTVLEPGPGMGFFTVELARLVGTGRVIALDIQPKMIEGLKRRVAKAGLLDRVDARVARKDSLGLNDLNGKVDFVLGGGRGDYLFTGGPQAELDVVENPTLHLNVSARSYKAVAITEWSNALLRGSVDEARQALAQTPDFPVVVTRNLQTAKQWLRYHTRGTARCGLVASSGAVRLRPEGFETSTGFHRASPEMVPKCPTAPVFLPEAAHGSEDQGPTAGSACGGVRGRPCLACQIRDGTERSHPSRVPTGGSPNHPPQPGSPAKKELTEKKGTPSVPQKADD